MDFTAQFVVFIFPLRLVLEKEGERFLEKSALVVKPAGRVLALGWVSFSLVVVQPLLLAV